MTTPTDADRLRRLLEDGHYSQREAARVLGVSQRMMRYWCAGEYPPPRTVLLALEHLAHCSPPKEGT